MVTLAAWIWAIGFLALLAMMLVSSSERELRRGNVVLTLIAYIFWPVSLFAVIIYATMEERRERASLMHVDSRPPDNDTEG